MTENKKKLSTIWMKNWRIISSCHISITYSSANHDKPVPLRQNMLNVSVILWILLIKSRSFFTNDTDFFIKLWQYFSRICHLLNISNLLFLIIQWSIMYNINWFYMHNIREIYRKYTRWCKYQKYFFICMANIAIVLSITALQNDLLTSIIQYFGFLSLSCNIYSFIL